MATPGNSCCCCVPCCFGLRGGVLLLAILQLIGGLFSILGLTIALIAGAAGYRGTFGEGEGGQTATEFYVTNGLYLIWAIFNTAMAITGVRATNNLEAVKNIDRAIVRRSRAYWRMSLFAQVVYFIVSLTSAIIATLLVNGSDDSGLSPQEKTFTLAFYWTFWLIGSVIQWYLLWVVWSYKARMQRAADGTLDGPYVVKGMYFTHGIQGCDTNHQAMIV